MFRTLSVALMATLLTGCSFFGVRSGTEQPPYQAVETLDESVELRRYGTRVAAEASVPLEDTEEGRNVAFRLLFKYITGANEGEAEIAMTAPVETASAAEIAMTAPVETARDAAGNMRMRFFLPAEYDFESAPKPTDPRVKIVALPPQTLAVLRFSGSRSEATVAERKEDLLQALAPTDWRPVAEPVAQFYDPPWTLPFLRRNEVAVEVDGG